MEQVQVRNSSFSELKKGIMCAYQRLYRERIVIISDEINSRRQMQGTVPSLLELYDSKSKDPIRVFIDTHNLGAQESIVLSNILQLSPVEVHTTLVGLVALGPAFVLAKGTPGKRVAFPNSKISFTSAPMEFDPFNPNMDLHTRYCKKLRDHRELVRKFMSLCAERTGLSEYELLSTMESKCILSPQEAIDFGIIDHVVNLREENEKRILNTLNPFREELYERRYYLL